MCRSSECDLYCVSTHDLQVAGVDQVGQREVDQPVAAAERHRRLGAVERSAASAACPRRLRGRSRGPSACPRCPTCDADPSAGRALCASAILTREYPPDVYGGAGVHVDFLVRELRRLVDVDVHCIGEPREGAHRAHRARPAGWPARTRRCRCSRTDLAMAAAVGRRATCVHSHTWYANMAGHLGKLLHGVPHVVTAHSLEPQRPWKAEQLGGGYRVSSWAERTAYEAADAVIAVSHGMAADILAAYPDARPGARCTSSTTASTPSSTGPTRHRRAGAARRRPGPAVRRRSSAGSPGRRASPHLLRAGPRLRPGAQLVLLRRRARHPGDRAPRPTRAVAELQAAARRRRRGLARCCPRAEVRPGAHRTRPCSSARRSTSRSASSTWRRWPARPPSWPATSAASPRSSSTARPALLVPYDADRPGGLRGGARRRRVNAAASPTRTGPRAMGAAGPRAGGRRSSAGTPSPADRRRLPLAALTPSRITFARVLVPTRRASGGFGRAGAQT